MASFRIQILNMSQQVDALHDAIGLSNKAMVKTDSSHYL